MAKLSFEEFIDVNETEFTIYFAESGSDRELDFDRDVYIEYVYDRPEQFKDYFIFEK